MLGWLKKRHRRWLPGLFVGVLAVLLCAFPPRWGLQLAGWIAPGAVYFADTDAKVVALTIDDGPHAQTTEAILKTLAQYDVQATFFLLSDHLSSEASTVFRLVADGHELGNHLTADEPSIRLPPDDFERKLISADARLSAYGPVQWFRPGMGLYNSRMVKAAQRRGYQLALGSVFPYDTHIPLSWFAVWFVLANVQPGDIIVLHDGPERGQRTAVALAQILPRLKARGYRVVTLSELFTISRSNHSTSQ
ncbi:MAG: chitin deacetylase family protein [Cyanobacteria bacterium J06648_16]